MDNTNFVDYIKIFCRSGNGGRGSLHFAKTKYNPNAGPDGGDGGKGGDVILRGNAQMWTLLPLRYKKHVHAQDGQGGQGNNRSGKYGNNAIIEVPLGTVARDEETNEIEAEILHDGQEIVWLPGGRGGLGNTHFKTATNQVPEYAQPGEPGVEGYKLLELKVLADVGLVGFPNAGKSTLLSSISAAKPKIANYAFTTLTPQLGIVPYKDDRSFAMADLPGIIEGAAEGRGLGHRFLRHIERNSILLFVIPADSADHAKEYRVLRSELEQYNPELLQKDFLIAISKSDMLDEELTRAIAAELPQQIPHVFISSISRLGIPELLDKIWALLTAANSAL